MAHIGCKLTLTHTHTCRLGKWPESNVIRQIGGKFLHLVAALARTQTVFLGKSFIKWEQSPVAQFPAELGELEEGCLRIGVEVSG